MMCDRIDSDSQLEVQSCAVSGNMGCSVSTAVAIDSKKLKPKDHSLDKEKDYDTSKFDPRLPITVRQKFNICRSWKAVGRNIGDTGINMFMRLFETNKDVRKLFKELEMCKDVSDLRNSKILENHVKMVMYTLDEAISSLDDVQFVIDTLHSVGQSHRRFVDFQPEIFMAIEEPFLLAVKETLGDRYTANVEFIYRKVIHFILQTLIDGFNYSK